MSGLSLTGWGALLGIAIASVSTLLENCAIAQITSDTTLPINSRIDSINSSDGKTILKVINGGTPSGGNLFHSFREFSVLENMVAVFNNASNIQNIISRVTGGSVSKIDGLIYANGTANLFLINPSGIIFGKNASLDIGGSFVATTANAIAFGNQGIFTATNPESSPSLLTVNPSALLFNQIKTAPIQYNSVALSDLNPTGLSVLDGKSLLLVGGDININGGTLNAFGGRVELGGLAGAGMVGLNGDGSNLSLSFPDSSVERSDVFLSNGAGVYVIAGNGGSIAVNARNLEMTRKSYLLAGIESGLDSEKSKPRNIEVNATRAINLNNGSYISNLVLPGANGQGGDVNIRTSTLQVQGGAKVLVDTFGAGKGGNLTVDAQDVQIIGQSGTGKQAIVLSASTQPNSSGDGGDLTIKTNTLLVRDGAQVGTGTSGAGKSGNLTVDAQDVQVIGTSADGQVGSGLFADAQRNSSRDGGDLKIKTNTLLVRDGARVSVSTFGAGKGGNLTVDAQDVQVIGTSADGQVGSGLFADVQPNSTRDGGDLKIKTNTLLVRDGAQVGAGTFGAGKGGNLTVDAQDVQLIGTSADGQVGSGLFTSTQTNLTGDGGDLTIKTNTLLVRDGAQVSSGTFGAGKGGNLTVDAQDVQLIGRSANGKFPSGFLADAQRNSSGDAGDLKIKTNTLLVRDGAQVSAGTFGAGKGGNLIVDAQDVQLIGASADGQVGSRLSTSVRPSSTGDGGDLKIKTNTLLVRNGAQVNSGTSGAGKGGNLIVDAQDVQLIGSADGKFATGLFASAQPNSTRDAGDLTIKTNTLLVQNGAQVSAGTFGAGKGGNLIVDAQDVQLIGSGDGQFPIGLFASAQPNSTGDAGDLTINTNTLLVQDGARVIVQGKRI
ncbi:filamentous hemagglutinin N-terminal domain-containing protein [Nostoc commune]|uniref:two-partner secretion domain-containing protein n=1 Tax=Nostoc commune TaxID=1178 RepID=UPI0018C6DDE6|nr:filamentous hemagglutinin N-terminal domain-containing protein [Nostoc commune]MBG1262150.1 filamentous hemagglutinin N-terminal domain-containing protein [Nostoc commune BAE]MBG1262642.1 filamentous hemagglutinin N-terminal domain-containing protein [Nostoc commune BAE]